MIALLRTDREGFTAERDYLHALRTGAGKARGGVVPSVELLGQLLGFVPAYAPSDGNTGGAPMHALEVIDALLRNARERTPPVLKAVLGAGALLATPVVRREELATLATSFVLCLGGATRDAWVSLPLSGDAMLAAGPSDSDPGWRDWLVVAFSALGREARAVVKGMEAVEALFSADEARTRAALGRAAYTALDVLGLLRSDLIITVPETARALGQTPPTAGAAVARLVELGIAREVTGRSRSRAFVYAGAVAQMAGAT
jgi:hypothetical protein